MKAIFLGAGASYECGMPLVWEFTNVLRANVFKRLDTLLFDFRKNPDFREQFEEILRNPEFHYEKMIGELEALYLGRGKYSDIAIHVARQLVDCIQVLLLEDQFHTSQMFSLKVKDYTGIRTVVAKNPGLTVFSLNHDVNFEEICKYHEVPCRDGFFEDVVQRYSNIANFKVLKKVQMEQGAFNFFGPEEMGISLLKLHGSLDIFAVEDKNLYLKCTPPASEKIGGHYLEIQKVEKHCQEVCNRMHSRTVGELNVLDINGELQFLRRSLLSGAHKFKGRFEQVAPVAFFQEFKRRITKVTELDVIGYGFGDFHINEVMGAWLRSGDVKLNIYDPYRENIPQEFCDAADKICILKYGLTGYFQSFDPSPDSIADNINRRLLEIARDRLKKRRISTWSVVDKSSLSERMRRHLTHPVRSIF